MASGPKVVVTTIPKSGTNLLGSILERIPPMQSVERIGFNARLRFHPYNFLPFGETTLMGIGRPQKIRVAAVEQRLRKITPGKYALGHIPYTESMNRLFEKHGMKSIVAIRDPRAMIVSSLRHGLKHTEYFLHDELKAMKSDADRLGALISGFGDGKTKSQAGIADAVDRIMGWIDNPDTLVVRFEDLVGSQGGGDDTVQQSKILELANFIGCPIDEMTAKEIGQDMFGKGRTFRTGNIDQWRSELDDTLLAKLREGLGERIGLLGYQF